VIQQDDADVRAIAFTVQHVAPRMVCRLRVAVAAALNDSAVGSWTALGCCDPRGASPRIL